MTKLAPENSLTIKTAGTAAPILIYHDVFAKYPSTDDSGLGAGAYAYGIEQQLFRTHVALFADHLRHNNGQKCLVPSLMTFDDGGISAYALIPNILEEFGVRGHFFIITDRVGKPGFLTKDHIRDLQSRGHAIGSHSHTHAKRFASLPRGSLEDEWKRSTDFLSNILGIPIVEAAIPGGDYSINVAKAAALSGIRRLFTSNPTHRVFFVDSCLIIGRFVILNSTSPIVLRRILSGGLLYSGAQQVRWQMKRMLKLSLGNSYFPIREKLLRAKLQFSRTREDDRR